MRVLITIYSIENYKTKKNYRNETEKKKVDNFIIKRFKGELIMGLTKLKPVLLLLLGLSILILTSCSLGEKEVGQLETPSSELMQTPIINNEPLPVQEETPMEEQVIIKTLYVEKDTDLYLSPSIESEAKTQVLRGTELGLLGEEGEWSKVVYENDVVYVLTSFLLNAKPMDMVNKPFEIVETPMDVVKPPSLEKLIVLDAGHQVKGSSTKEANGPGSSILKARVSSGTRGVATKLYEYELNLMVTLKLRTELESRGYQVILVRDNHEVDISNIERAQVANDAGADAFIRIHANGSDDSSVHGMLTICQTSSNPYNANTYKESYALSDRVLKKMVEATGARDRGIWQTDTMTGINWSEVPSTIVEMGFMSNPKEDELLSTEDYQNKVVQGIVNGIDDFFTLE